METRTRAAIVLAALVALAGCAEIKSFLRLGPRPAAASGDVAAEPARAKTGALLLAGGGHTPGAVIAEAARLTSGTSPRVVVIPLAASSAEAGKTAADTWKRAGFLDCEVLAADPTRANEQIASATFLWLTGGDATSLAGRLLDADVVARIRERFEEGALVGGTNVGASAVAELVIASAAEEDELRQGQVETVGGLGLWPGTIVDGAFVARQRFNRLSSAVLDHPHCVGVGIDEGTGVVVEGTRIRVVGEGNVVVLDARKAGVVPSRRGDPSAATGVSMQVLAAGMTFDLASR